MDPADPGLPPQEDVAASDLDYVRGLIVVLVAATRRPRYAMTCSRPTS